MSRCIVPLVCILVLAWAPGLAGAQGFPTTLGSGLPSLSGLWGGGGCAPVCDPKSGGGLVFNIGYLATNRNLAFDLSAERLLGAVISLRYEYPVDGLWLAVSAYRPVGDGFGIFARGSWLVPSHNQADHTYLLTIGTVESRRWRTKVQWYNADIAGTYSPHGALTAIGGFRFDSFDTTFHDRDVEAVDELPTDVHDLTVTAYIPYVGMMVNQGSALKVGLIGFPYVPGNIKNNRTYGSAVLRHEATGSLRTSYFLEAFAEYGGQLMGGYVGIFGIWTFFHGNSVLDVTRIVGGGGTTSGQYQFSMNRQNWILGGNFRMNFASPI